MTRPRLVNDRLLRIREPNVKMPAISQVAEQIGLNKVGSAVSSITSSVVETLPDPPFMWPHTTRVLNPLFWNLLGLCLVAGFSYLLYTLSVKKQGERLSGWLNHYAETQNQYEQFDPTLIKPYNYFS
jgi:hypothetical protein